MFELADELKRLRDLKADLEEQVEEVNARIKETDFRLSEQMILNEVQNFNRAGSMFCLTTKTYASAGAGRKDELYVAIRAHGFGGLITETIHANSLASFVKERMEESKENRSGAECPGSEETLPTWLTGLVHTFKKTSVGVRKSTKS
jgi:hypothetical protein